MRTKKINNEVIYTDERVTKVDNRDINQLKEMSLGNERKRIRLCTHRDEKDSLHEMLIIHARNTYVRPHKHINKSESFHVIEGSVDVVIFDEEGKITDVISMGDYLSNSKFYFRISNPLYHSMIIKSDFLVFHETTNGPFNKSDCIFAPWSPEETDNEGTNNFLSQLGNSIGIFLSRPATGLQT